MIHAWAIRIITWLAIGGAVFAFGFGAGVNTANRDHTKRMAELEKKRQAEAVVVDKIVTKYVEKIITREVPVYVPSPDACRYLDGNFRVFFDSIAADKRLPEASEYTDAATVAVADVADITSDNFRICHNTADQLRALQAWANEVTR